MHTWIQVGAGVAIVVMLSLHTRFMYRRGYRAGRASVQSYIDECMARDVEDRRERDRVQRAISDAYRPDRGGQPEGSG